MLTICISLCHLSIPSWYPKNWGTLPSGLQLTICLWMRRRLRRWFCTRKGQKVLLPHHPCQASQGWNLWSSWESTLNDTLTFDEHVCRTVSQSSQSLYALRVLRAHGLEGAALWDVTRATLVSKMLYASPVWWGSITAAAKQRLQSLLSKLQRIGFLPQQFSTFAELCEQADRSLFFFNYRQFCARLSQLAPSNPPYWLWPQEKVTRSYHP